MDSPLVSIIVPVYNGKKYIKRIVDKLTRQTYGNIEVIFVNDGSNDGSGELCDELVQSYSEIRVIHQDNKGLSGARNTGILNAIGEYVLFIDVDDLVSETIVEDNLRLALQEDADVVLFSFWYNRIEKGECVKNEYKGVFVGDKKQYFESVLCSNVDYEIFNAPWNKLIKKQILLDNNIFFDSTYSVYEDIVFAPKLMSVANKIVVNDNNYYIYNIQSAGTLLSSFHRDTFEALKEFYRQAMLYCELFEDNSKQKDRLAEVYLKHTFTYLKQISKTKTIKVYEKNSLIKAICSTKSLIVELTKVRYSGKKELMRRLILQQNSFVIMLLYKMC